MRIKWEEEKEKKILTIGSLSFLYLCRVMRNLGISTLWRTSSLPWKSRLSLYAFLSVVNMSWLASVTKWLSLWSEDLKLPVV